ncbi:MAG: BNR repeat-containing protein [Flavisolibacter sp.]
MRYWFIPLVFISSVCFAQKVKVILVAVDSGWANNSVNTTIFRKNSLVSFHNWQYIAFYDKNGIVVLGKRKLGENKWQLKKTGLKGNVTDAHNVISIIVDGDGYLHMAWNHHNNSLHYVKSREPGSLELTQELSMTGIRENKLSYPEFYHLPDGDLIFFYRDGGSGNGSLVMNHYSTKAKAWTQVQNNLIDGEGQRSAYWQACIDTRGTIHLSWVWRETPDVASNHDLCYAQSMDGGRTWQRSDGEIYHLPITAANAEYALHIPQHSELINQTSMYADASGHPFIASYWRDEGSTIPQYHIVLNQDGKWKTLGTDFRKTAFSLSGAGTKRVPISRPQIIAWNSGAHLAMALIFRDEERGNKISVALNKNIEENKWTLIDLLQNSVGSWEPSYDTELWKTKQQLHLFVQKVEQLDAEGSAHLPAQMVEVLEWDPKKEK